MAHFNLDKLIRISVKDYKESVRYSYVTEKRLFGLKIRKKGLYDSWIDDYFDELSSEYVLENGKVYEKPLCKLIFQDNFEVEYIFDTLDEAKKFRDDIISDRNYIEY